jgi:hypothetical protein
MLIDSELLQKYKHLVYCDLEEMTKMTPDRGNLSGKDSHKFAFIILLFLSAFKDVIPLILIQLYYKLIVSNIIHYQLFVSHMYNINV